MANFLMFFDPSASIKQQLLAFPLNLKSKRILSGPLMARTDPR